MDKQEFMAHCGTSTHATYFVYDHHHVYAHATNQAISFNFGSSHVSLLCDSREHMLKVVTKFMQDLIYVLNQPKETDNDQDS